MAEAYRECPICARAVADAPTLCPFCGGRLPPPRRELPKPRPYSEIVTFRFAQETLAGFVLVGAFVTVLSSTGVDRWIHAGILIAVGALACGGLGLLNRPKRHRPPP